MKIEEYEKQFRFIPFSIKVETIEDLMYLTTAIAETGNNHVKTLIIQNEIPKLSDKFNCEAGQKGYDNHISMYKRLNEKLNAQDS